MTNLFRIHTKIKYMTNNNKTKCKTNFFGRRAVFGIIVALGLCSCGNKSADATSEAGGKDVEVTRITKEIPSFGDEKSIIDCEYPTAGDTALLQNVREWINEILGDDYEGNLADAETMFSFYSQRMEDDKDSDQRLTKMEIKKVYENDRIVTFTCEGYEYFNGAAHGLGYEIGATFRKSDGKMFTKDMIRSVSAVQPYVVEGLKDYFEVATDEELTDCLLLPSASDTIPLPTANPWITEDGVTFCYMAYEIAAYAAGQPSFVIPASDIKDYLTTVGKTFLE